MSGKHIVLQREIQRTVVKTEAPELQRDFLRPLVGQQPAGIARPGCAKTRRDFVQAESSQGSLVRIVQKLPKQTRPGEPELVEVGDARIDDSIQKVLGRLDVDKSRLPARIGKAGGLRHEREKKTHMLLDQTVKGANPWLTKSPSGSGGSKRVAKAAGLRPACRQRENPVGAHATSKPVNQLGGKPSGLATPRWAVQIYPHRQPSTPG